MSLLPRSRTRECLTAVGIDHCIFTITLLLIEQKSSGLLHGKVTTYLLALVTPEDSAESVVKMKIKIGFFSYVSGSQNGRENK